MKLPGDSGTSIRHDGMADLPKPAMVEEAERTVRRFGFKLGAVGAVGTLAFWAVIAAGATLPLSWWIIFLLALVAVFFYPPTRKANAARAALDRYDQLKIDQALESGGTISDPRLRVAEAMTRRILDGPRLGAAERRVVGELLQSLRKAARDLRIAEVAQHNAGSGSDSTGRALSDFLDLLEARSTRLLGAMAEIHSAVVRRERHEIEVVLQEARVLLHQVEADSEVAQLLADEAEEGRDVGR